jgi:hypothetical protein
MLQPAAATSSIVDMGLPPQRTSISPGAVRITITSVVQTALRNRSPGFKVLIGS